MLELTHEYKGYKIDKMFYYYWQGSETYYVVDGKRFERLKDAKSYIDSLTH